MHNTNIFAGFSIIEPIIKGMSGDKKYFVETPDSRRFLLRVADVSEYECKKNEFEMMKQASALVIPMSQPVDFGVCNDGSSVYTLLTWIDGEEAEFILPKLTESEQYNLGVKFGEILCKIHTIPGPAGFYDWAERYFCIMDKRLDAFRTEGIFFDGYEVILSFLEDNRHLLIGRPQCFHHGDFHEGNLIISQSGDLSVIDWHTVDFDHFGDPWYEFNRIGTGFPAFASGQIDGYLGGKPPREFWMLLAYYLSASAITSVVWAKYYAPERLKAILQLNVDVLHWFSDFQSLVPTWYVDSEEIEKRLYINDPCGSLSTAFWKKSYFKKPEGITISRERDKFSGYIDNSTTRYFKLFHSLREINDTELPDGYYYRNAVLPDEAVQIADFINRCYEGYSITADVVMQWTHYPVFDKTLWVFICEKETLLPVAFGIADYDPSIEEGSLEWIQVLPDKRGMGLGQKIVNELLSKLRGRAKFVTVSGECDNSTNPEKLYRRCGFTGDEIWRVIRRQGK